MYSVLMGYSFSSRARRAALAAAALSLAACGGPPPEPAAPGMEPASGEPVVAVVAEPQEPAGQDPQEPADPKPKGPAEDASPEPLVECIAALRDGRGMPPGAQGLPEQALYTTALANERGGSLDAARKGYFRLIQQYPASPFIPLAYFAFGEMFLNDSLGDPSKIPLALQSFQEVVKYPPPANTAHLAASMRLATAHGLKQDGASALAAAHKVLTGVTQAPGAPCAASLSAAARDQMVTSYGEAGRPEVAFSFFRSSAGEGPAYSMLASLAGAYFTSKQADSGAKALLSAPASVAPADFCSRETRLLQDHGASLAAGQKAKLTSAHTGRCPNG